MAGESVLVLQCKASDYDAATHVCTQPFYGAQPMLLPEMSAEEGVLMSASIIGCWAIGFFIKQARRPVGG